MADAIDYEKCLMRDTRFRRYGMQFKYMITQRNHDFSEPDRWEEVLVIKMVHFWKSVDLLIGYGFDIHYIFKCDFENGEMFARIGSFDESDWRRIAIFALHLNHVLKKAKCDVFFGWDAKREEIGIVRVPLQNVDAIKQYLADNCWNVQKCTMLDKYAIIEVKSIEQICVVSGFDGEIRRTPSCVNNHDATYNVYLDYRYELDPTGPMRGFREFCRHIDGK